MLEIENSALERLRHFLAERGGRGIGVPQLSWPAGGSRNVVMSVDTGVELGSPREESFSFLLLVNRVDLIRDGMVSVVGPDLQESRGGSLPLGKVIIAGMPGAGREDCYGRYRELDFIKYDIDLLGYMMRGASSHRREWIRISREALERGFSLGVLGGALVRKFKEMPFVGGVEVLLVTSCGQDVQELREIMSGAVRAVDSARKMAIDSLADCGTCEYGDICSRVGRIKTGGR